MQPVGRGVECQTGIGMPPHPLPVELSPREAGTALCFPALLVSDYPAPPPSTMSTKQRNYSTVARR